VRRCEREEARREAGGERACARVAVAGGLKESLEQQATAAHPATHCDPRHIGSLESNSYVRVVSRCRDYAWFRAKRETEARPNARSEKVDSRLKR